MTAIGRYLAAIPPDEFVRRVLTFDPDTRRAALRERYRFDRRGMIRRLWGSEYTLPFAAPHDRILDTEKVPWNERLTSGQKQFRAMAAPRGVAKTATTVADLCHDVLYGYERVVPILSAELTLSRNSIATIREMLAADTVTELYGACAFSGGTDRLTVTTADGYVCTFIAKSFGTSVRGLKVGNIRPTRLIVDDGEDKHLVNNPEQRRKWRAFLSEDILKLGQLSGGLIVDWIGTVLHPDSVLANLLSDLGWDSQRFSAMIKPPTRADLWEACSRAWAGLGSDAPGWRALAETAYAARRGPNMRPWDRLEEPIRRHETARAFYTAHKAAMDEGCEMLAPAWISVLDYHVAMWTEGRASVRKELDNDPIDPSTCLFDLTRIKRCRFDGATIWTSRGTAVPLSRCKVAIWLDHSKGGKASDYPAICTVLRDPEGFRYWVGCDLTRRQPSARHAALWATWERYYTQRPKVGMDATGTQGLLGEAMARIQRDRRNAGKPWDMDLKEYSYTASEGAATQLIEEWEPALHNGWVEVAEDIPAEAINQLRDFPNADHDDALAAAERADWLLNPATMPTVLRSVSLGK